MLLTLLSGRARARVMVVVFTVLLLSVSLACGLGITGSSQESGSFPIDLSGKLGSGSSGGDAATISQVAPTREVEPTGEAAEESETGPGEDETLAENQVFVLPGGNPPTMDPHLSGDATSAEYVVEIFSGLMSYDMDLNLVPDIAESYEVSEDGLVYTFTIRSEARFHDGKPVRAEDFKWSFERACDPATGSPTAHTYLGDIVGCQAKLAGEAEEVEGVNVVDDLTLQLTIDEPKGFFLAKMTYPTAYVLDRETVEEGGDDWAAQPNGSGPFKLEQFAPTEGVIVLARNDEYYRDPVPTLERVVYLVDMPINPMTGYEQDLSSLGLPAGVSYDAIPVSISDLSRATDPNNPLSDEFASTDALSVFYIGFNVQEPPFDEVEVRQALNLALDKERLVRLVFQGTVPAANGIVPVSMPGYENPNLEPYEFDPERALELIAESSYGDVSELPEITLYVSGAGGNVGPVIEAIVESYNQNLGLEIAVEQLPWAEFLQDLNQPDMPYQMYQLGWIADYPDPQNFLEVLFHSDSAQNHGNYSNPAVDALLDEVRGALDPEQRLALYQEAEQLILNDAAWIPIYFEVENWLVKPYVKNFRVPPIKIPKFQTAYIVEH